MSSFGVGDRVRVYGIILDSKSYVRDGCVEKFVTAVGTSNGFERVYVKLDDPVQGNPIIAYPQQCRKLKPKKKRAEMWIKKCFALDSRPVGSHVLVPVCTEQHPGDFQSIRLSTDGWIKFREVKEK